MPGSLPFNLQPTPLHDLTSNFIACATNPYATMHYDITSPGARTLNQCLNPFVDKPGGRSSPATMEDSDHVIRRRQQVYRDAIRHRHREHQPAGAGAVSIHPLNLHPAHARLVPGDSCPVNLVPQDRAVESWLRSAERPPPRHYLSDWILGPEAQVEPRCWTLPPPRDSGDDAKLLAPTGNLEARHRTGQFRLAERESRGTQGRRCRQDWSRQEAPGAPIGEPRS